MKKLALLVVFLVFCHAGPSLAATIDLPDGSKLNLEDICPVCKMKIESSVLGPAAIVLKDGKVLGFDAAGDLFRYYLEPEKYGLDVKQIKEMYVTEYGTKNFLNAKDALYVTGSDLQEGMGPELAPFSKKEDAEKFKSEHHGKNISKFSDLKMDDLKSAKKKLKMEHGHGSKH